MCVHKSYAYKKWWTKITFLMRFKDTDVSDDKDSFIHLQGYKQIAVLNAICEMKIFTFTLIQSREQKNFNEPSIFTSFLFHSLLLHFEKENENFLFFFVSIIVCSKLRVFMCNSVYFCSPAFNSSLLIQQIFGKDVPTWLGMQTRIIERMEKFFDFHDWSLKFKED